MCAVRALTEGQAPVWWPKEPATVTGVVLRMTTVNAPYSTEPVPCVDLWTGGMVRVQVRAYGATIRNALREADPQIGDTLTVTFEGEREIDRGKFRGQRYRHHTVTVERGHHR